MVSVLILGTQKTFSPILAPTEPQHEITLTRLLITFLRALP